MTDLVRMEHINKFFGHVQALNDVSFSVRESEIVGLVPANALLATAEHYLQLTGFSAQQVLENKVRAATS